MKKMKMLVVLLLISASLFAVPMTINVCKVCGNTDGYPQYAAHNPLVHGYKAFVRWWNSTDFMFDFNM